MATRRNFLSGAVAFCGCGMLHEAQAQAQAPRRQAVAVGGQRVRTIDVHAHCLFPEAADILGVPRPSLLGQVRNASQLYLGVEERFAAMDAQKVDLEVLSINPFWYDKPRDQAAAVVKLHNEKMAELCARHPDRFAGFASLTLQDPALAVQELETAVRRQGLKGAAIGTHVNGEEFPEPKFHPVWQKAEELGAVLFIHPPAGAPTSGRFRGNGWLANTIGNPLDTTIALSHLIFQGTLDRFPGLKIIAAHGGGYLPSYADRSDHACLVNPGGCDPSIQLKKKPSEYLRQIWFDSLVFSAEAIRHLQAQVGAGQLVMGSDWPFPWQMAPVDPILACDSLDDAQKRAVLGGTAARLLRIAG